MSKTRSTAKKPAARARKPRPRYTAATADKYELYQKAVQSADTDVEFLTETYQAHNGGRKPRHLREDFCGTSLICCEWVKLHAENTAEGYDLDPEPIEWGKTHNHSQLTDDQAGRIRLFLEDARDKGRKKPDVRVAQNFSYWLFRERAELLAYFKIARKSLAEGGIFVIDLYGGTESTVEMLEERKVEGGFTYVWDQDEYFPGTAEFFTHIHFHFRDGTKLEKAFSYHWRQWGMAELKDLLAEAGFSKVTSYFEGDDEDDPEEGNGIFEPDERGENCEAWIGYLVSQR